MSRHRSDLVLTPLSAPSGDKIKHGNYSTEWHWALLFSQWFFATSRIICGKCRAKKSPAKCGALSLRRDRDSNSGIAIRRWRISNPLHYHSATSPVGYPSGMRIYTIGVTFAIYPILIWIFFSISSTCSLKSRSVSIRFWTAWQEWITVLWSLPPKCFPITLREFLV